MLIVDRGSNMLWCPPPFPSSCRENVFNSLIRLVAIMVATLTLVQPGKLDSQSTRDRVLILVVDGLRPDYITAE